MQHWLAARAEASPHKPALYLPHTTDLITNITADDSKDVLMFGELYAAAQTEAARLQALGIQRGQHVALAPFSIREDVVAIFALMLLGCVIVPINTRLTHEEVIFQCQQAEASAILCYDAVQRERYADIPACPLLPDYTPDDMQPYQPTPDAIAMDDVCVIIHTSGTSGKPKGAMLTYGNIYQSAMASAYRIGVHTDDNWLCVLPLFHVGGLSIILRSVLYGTAVTLLPRFDVAHVNAMMTTQPITLVSLVPTMLYRLLSERDGEWHEALRLVLLGGAAPSAQLVRACVAADIPLATTYGLSEAASQVATATPQQVIAKPGSVGKPLLFTQVRVVGDDGHNCDVGDIGEIQVWADTVMRGYYGNAQATAKTIRDGWLYTGDLGHFDGDGDLWIVQRRSDLIISGGENIYPAEVEAVLLQHEAIAAACVVGVDDAEWGQIVAAAIVQQQGFAIDRDAVLVFARQHLAGYKIPRRILLVDDLPKTASGKVMRRAVEAMF